MKLYSLAAPTKKLSDCFALPYRFEILVPSTVNVNDVASQETIDGIVNFVADSMASNYGGSQVLDPIVGRWISSEVGRVLEPVIPVVCYSPTKAESDERFMLAIAELVKTEMSQESVFMLFDGVAYLV